MRRGIVRLVLDGVVLEGELLSGGAVETSMEEVYYLPSVRHNQDCEFVVVADTISLDTSSCNSRSKKRVGAMNGLCPR